MKTLLTTKELAERWSLAVGSLENWRQQGRGPKFVKLGGAKNSEVRYRVRDIEEFEKSHLFEETAKG